MKTLRWNSHDLEVMPDDGKRYEDAVLTLHKTLYPPDQLQSPLLPGFACQVSQLFMNNL